MDTADLLMTYPQFDGRPGEYECKRCYGEFDYRPAHKSDAGSPPDYCPHCGRKVGLVFDLEAGREKRDTKRGRWGRKFVGTVEGRWELIGIKPFEDDWGNMEMREYHLHVPFARGNQEKRKQLVRARKSETLSVTYDEVKIIRRPPTHFPKLPQ